MLKVNKRLILILIAALTMGALAGCENQKVEFAGVESKKLTKDLTELRNLLIESIREKDYKEKEIDKILSKINDSKYKETLSNTEILLIEHINTFKEDVKYDLTNGKKILTSSTYEDINWLLQATD